MTYVIQVDTLDKCWQAFQRQPARPCVKADITAKKASQQALRKARDAVAPLIFMFDRELLHNVWGDLDKEFRAQAEDMASNDVDWCAEEWMDEFERKICIFMDDDGTWRWHTRFSSTEWAALIVVLRDFADGPPPSRNRFTY